MKLHLANSFILKIVKTLVHVKNLEFLTDYQPVIKPILIVYVSTTEFSLLAFDGIFEISYDLNRFTVLVKGLPKLEIISRRKIILNSLDTLNTITLLYYGIYTSR